MAPIPQRPENVLKRAEELVSVGQSSAALNSLHDLIVSKRSKSASIASLEPFMLRLVELAVEQRKGKVAKEGLYQYKNIAQNTSIETLVTVVTRFLDLAESKFREARDKAEQINLDTIDDLEATETPESILLSTVSSDEAKDRTDRAIVTPWLRFLWEAYRTVLDILRNNGRLEMTYQRVSLKALDFCQNHGRRTEFRRLCDLLRNHLQTAAKYQSQPHGINLNDPDTLQRHLDTRFAQLNTAVAMELWQEAFRSVEDIHNLLTIAKRPPKPSTMANYYEKLSKIFLVSGNYLFHAAAFNRYATIVRLQNKNATDEELEKLGSLALLSALAIPTMREGNPRGVAMDLDEQRNKNVRLAALLNMSTPPTRAGLLREALVKGARPIAFAREIHAIFETQFLPLDLCTKVQPLLAQVASREVTKHYVEPLQQVAMTKLFQQLSRVYETVSFDYVVSLTSAFDLPNGAVEKFIMLGCKRGEFAMRIDHANNAITFDSDVLEPANERASDRQVSHGLQATPAELVRSQLTRLARCLYSTLSHVDPAFCEERAALKKAAISRSIANAEREHEETVARAQIIERRKELANTVRQKREQEEAAKRALQQQREVEAENKRQAEDARRRELDRIKREQDKIKADESKRLVEELKASGTNLELDDAELEQLDTAKLRALQLEALEKSTRDINERMRITAKRIDHLERAFRRAEIPMIEQSAKDQALEDRANFTAQREASRALAKQKHEDDLVLKQRMVRVLPDYAAYRERLVDRRGEAFKEKRERAMAKLEQEKEKRREQFRQRQQEEEEQRAREEEARAREEEEREAREARAAEEAELKRQQDAERQQKLEEARRQREQERQKLDEQAQRQREREQAAEAKLRARREGGPGASAPPSSGARASAGVYRPGQGKWSSQRVASSQGGAGNGDAYRRDSPASGASGAGMGSRQASREAYTPPYQRQGSREASSSAAAGGAGGFGSRQPSRSTPSAAPSSPRPDPDATNNNQQQGQQTPAAGTAGKYVPRHLRQQQQQGGGAAGGSSEPSRRSSGW
ncbi:eukaryotic translation initiation factor 3 subunit A [Savitreella phatthalungensis]